MSTPPDPYTPQRGRDRTSNALDDPALTNDLDSNADHLYSFCGSLQVLKAIGILQYIHNKRQTERNSLKCKSWFLKVVLGKILVSLSEIKLIRKMQWKCLSDAQTLSFFKFWSPFKPPYWLSLMVNDSCQSNTHVAAGPLRWLKMHTAYINFINSWQLVWMLSGFAWHTMTFIFRGSEWDEGLLLIDGCGLLQW